MSPPSKRWDEALPLGEPCAASSQADLLSSIATNTAASQADGICSICRIDQLPSGLEEPKSDPITGQRHGTCPSAKSGARGELPLCLAHPACRGTTYASVTLIATSAGRLGGISSTGPKEQCR